MNDIELAALTALVNFDRANWEYYANRYGEAKFDPQTRHYLQLCEEMARRFPLTVEAK